MNDIPIITDDTHKLIKINNIKKQKKLSSNSLSLSTKLKYPKIPYKHLKRLQPYCTIRDNESGTTVAGRRSSKNHKFYEIFDRVQVPITTNSFINTSNATITNSSSIDSSSNFSISQQCLIDGDILATDVVDIDNGHGGNHGVNNTETNDNVPIEQNEIQSINERISEDLYRNPSEFNRLQKFRKTIHGLTTTSDNRIIKDTFNRKGFNSFKRKLSSRINTLKTKRTNESIHNNHEQPSTSSIQFTQTNLLKSKSTDDGNRFIVELVNSNENHHSSLDNVTGNERITDSNNHHNRINEDVDDDDINDDDVLVLRSINCDDNRTETTDLLHNSSNTTSSNNATTNELAENFLNALTQSSSDITEDISDNNMRNVLCINSRPRQMGRRNDDQPRVVSIMTEMNAFGDQRITINRDDGDESDLTLSDENSRNPNSLTTEVPSNTGSESITMRRMNRTISTSSQTNNNTSLPSSSPPHQSDVSRPTNSKSPIWPFNYSRLLAGSCCTLGLFNLSRFAIYSVHYGANFILQFIILSVIFGIPLLWLHICLGSKLKSGCINMWRISPICIGIGISLLLFQMFIGIYSTICISWLLVYLRDSFLSSSSTKYAWQEEFWYYHKTVVKTAVDNITIDLSETVPDYFNGIVLQRYRLLFNTTKNDSIGAVRFQLAFNLACIWITVFVILCKGTLSYGKIVCGYFIVEFIGLICLCIKFLITIGWTNFQDLFSSTDWQDFFAHSNSWFSAAQEVFLTWTLFGPSIICIFSKLSMTNEPKTNLRRDAIAIVLITLFGLVLIAILANACTHIISDESYVYIGGSFETLNSSIFMHPKNSILISKYISTPNKWWHRYSTILGENYRIIGGGGFNGLKIDTKIESGFQFIRLITEIFPTAVAIATLDRISSFWTILGFFIFMLFAIGQLCAIWKPIIELFGNQVVTTLITCIMGLLIGIPLTTENGIKILYFFDIIIGGSWWIPLLWTMYIFGLFLIRGRPYSGDILILDLKLFSTLSSFVALSWNVLLPIGLITLCITEYRYPFIQEFYQWRNNLTYWPLWIRKSGGIIQIIFLLLTPIISVIQIYRYLSNGPSDILERVQLLYRPRIISSNRPEAQRQGSLINNSSSTADEAQPTVDNDVEIEDIPPTYTPPPSYTTATGMRIAKLLRSSLRRSVKRILGESSRQTATTTEPFNHHTTTQLQLNLAHPDNDLTANRKEIPLQLHFRPIKRTDNSYHQPSNSRNSIESNETTLTILNDVQLTMNNHSVDLCVPEIATSPSSSCSNNNNNINNININNNDNSNNGNNNDNILENDITVSYININDDINESNI